MAPQARQVARVQETARRLRGAALELMEESSSDVVGLRQARSKSGLSDKAVKNALPLLAAEFAVEEGKVPGGNGALSQATVLRRITNPRDGGTEPRPSR